MEKSGYGKAVDALFIVMAGLTFLSLRNNMVWLSYVLSALFLLFIALHARDYRRELPKNKKVFVLTLIILINFLLANAVVVVANYVYPY
ncbi:MAG: hypothetical protein P4L75_04210 [Clostridia bacterium]|nr:hypothetical protein [Clostridia bacterium]MDR3644066.1 hypothetical protein [Clostridia bacterium]